jgi:DUF4097 and DUF4098 domain-containing protein YvlB
MRKIVAFAALAGFVFALPAAAEGCKFTKDHAADVKLGGAKRIVVTAGAGELTVRGEDGRAAAGAAGRACASSQELLDQIRIESRVEGDAVHVRTILPDMADDMFGFSRYARMDLTVLVPKAAVLSIEDSSGDLQLSNVQAATVADSSGDQDIRDVAGDLDVTDSSGEIEIERVGGNLRLKDSSGDVDVNDVRGNVEVTVDSSGGLEIERVAGAVHILSDSSGDIGITEVQRDVTIDSDSSGSIQVERIGGNFTVGADGSGGITHNRVMGKVQIPDND